MAKPPVESRIPLFSKPSQPPMSYKTSKNKVEEILISGHLKTAILKPSSGIAIRNPKHLYDELNIDAPQDAPPSAALGQVSPKRSKFTRPKPATVVHGKEAKYLARAVSNETVNIPDLLHSTKAAPSFTARTKPVSKRALHKDKNHISQPLAKPTLGAAFSSGNDTFSVNNSDYKSKNNFSEKINFQGLNDIRKASEKSSRILSDYGAFTPKTYVSSKGERIMWPPAFAAFSNVEQQPDAEHYEHFAQDGNTTLNSNLYTIQLNSNTANSTFALQQELDEQCAQNEKALLNSTFFTDKKKIKPENSTYSSQKELDEFRNNIAESDEPTNGPSKNQRPNNLGLNTKNYSVASDTHFVSKTADVASSAPAVKNARARVLDAAVIKTEPPTVDDIGRQVIVSDEKLGVLKFVGGVEFESGLFCGVELDGPEGRHDGKVKEKRYFSCQPQHGILAPIWKVKLYNGASVIGEELGKKLMETEPIPPTEFTPTPSSTTSSKHGWDASVDNSKSSNLINTNFSKQNSFEFDESLGILTPDQMSDLPDATNETMQFSCTVGSQHPGELTQRFFKTGLVDFTVIGEQSFGSTTFQRGLDLTQLGPGNMTLQCGLTTTELDVAVYESDVSDDLLSRAVGHSKSDPKAQDVSDRTLSPEDLPMDPPSPHQALLMKGSTEEPKLDLLVMSAGSAGSPGPSSRSMPPPASFVTSITSVGSLDTDGYQGDGELSRPASRNTCTSPVAIMQKACTLKMKTSTQDPMTDSDFFTESDADVHDDVGGGSRGGDRRAQVIDGTLYNNTGSANSGNANQQHQRCPSFTASINEETESSGVYSDLERKPEERETLNTDNEKKEDCSPDASTKTVSSRSEASQVNEANVPIPPTESSLDTTLTELNVNGSFVEEAMDVVIEHDEKEEDFNSFRPTNISTPNILTDVKPSKKIELKKHTMPKRNVQSKVKSRLEAPVHRSVEDVSLEASRRSSASKSPRPGRWDAVMSKIAQGQADDKLKPARLKEVKSKVFAGICDGAPVGATKRKAEQTSAKKENMMPLKLKTRRARTRASSSSSVQPMTPNAAGAKTPVSGNSSQNSSLSDVSLGHKASVASTTSTHRSSKKQRDVGRSTSPVSDISTNSTTSHLTPAHGTQKSANQLATRQLVNGGAPTVNGGVSKRHSVDANTSNKRQHLHVVQPVAKAKQDKNATGAPAEMKTPLVRKPTSRRNEKHKLSRDHNRFAGVNKLPAGGSDGVSAPAVTSTPPPRTTPTPTSTTAATPASVPGALEAAKKRVKQLETSRLGHVTAFDAMTAVVAHLVNHYDALSAPRLHRELETSKSARNEASLALDEMAANLRRLEEKLAQSEADRQLLVAANQAVNEQRQLEIEQLKEVHAAELTEVTKKCDELKEQSADEILRLSEQHMCQQEAAVAALRSEHEASVAQLEADSKKRYDQLQVRHDHMEADYHTAKDQSRALYESLQQDKETRIQFTAGRCKELQEEASSLRAVLELRHIELQDLRQKNDILARDADEMQAVNKKASALQARVEDLELQLSLKKEEQRQLSADYANLSDRFQHESIGNKRLSQVNEELAWKLKHKLKVFNLLSKSHVPESECSSPRSTDHRSTKSFSESLLEKDYLMSPTKTDPCQGQSPSPCTVTSMLERSDSVAWILEMDDETPEDAAQKILLKKSASNRKCMSGKRGTATSPRRVLDVGELEYVSWSPDTSTPKSTSGAVTCVRRDQGCANNENGTHVDFQDDPPKCMTSSSSSQSSHDEMEKTILPLLPASSSSELVLLTQKPPVPKNAGGEAMVSVETSEEDNSVEPSDDDSSSDIQ